MGPASQEGEKGGMVLELCSPRPSVPQQLSNSAGTSWKTGTGLTHPQVQEGVR